MNSPLAITGTGAVSPAGWGVPAMCGALKDKPQAEAAEIERPLAGGAVRTRVLRVPTDAAASPKAARLRRTSPIAKFAAAAMNEAVGKARLEAIADGSLHVGVIFTLMNGCVNYSNRFFGEVLMDPSLASPILFPETVFNAPSSHLSAFIGSTGPNDTLIGDGACFFSGVEMAAEWILRGDVDGCVVVAAEEIDWLSAEALALYSQVCLPAEGAGAIYLEKSDGPVRLIEVPDPVPFSAIPREEAALAFRSRLRSLSPHALLVDGRCGDSRIDRPESAAWHDWSGRRISPRQWLGEGLGASAAWQTVAAVEAVVAGEAEQAVVVALGANQQAAGMVIGR